MPKTHGLSRIGGEKTPEYRAWQAMISRCERPANKSFSDYGGRGIAVCARWRESFAAFLEDMGTRPSPKHSLDRHPDNNGNYEPGNCRWATAEEQQLNRRDTIRIGGRLLREAANAAGLNFITVKGRIYRGWPQHLWLAPRGTRP